MIVHVELAREEAGGESLVHSLVCVDGLPPPNLDAIDYLLLEQWTARRNWREMAQAAKIAPGTAKARMGRPVFQDALARLQRTFFDQLARGEFGVLALAKANAVGAFKRILAIAKHSEDDKIKFMANKEILALAGIQPPKPQVIESPDRLIDLMTPEEAAHFAETNEFPRRLSDKLARVAAGVLQDRKATVVEDGVVDAAVVEATADDDGPREVPDDDESPVGFQLPDEEGIGE